MTPSMLELAWNLAGQETESGAVDRRLLRVLLEEREELAEELRLLHGSILRKDAIRLGILKTWEMAGAVLSRLTEPEEGK